jgi:hypothetical protein
LAFPGSFDQPLRKIQLCAHEAFSAAHLSAVDLVVVASKVQQAVEDEDFYFSCKRVALRG